MAKIMIEMWAPLFSLNEMHHCGNRFEKTMNLFGE